MENKTTKAALLAQLSRVDLRDTKLASGFAHGLSVDGSAFCDCGVVGSAAVARSRGKLRPNSLPIVGAKVAAGNPAIAGEFQSDTVFRARQAASVLMLPLANLCITLDLIAERNKALPKLRNSQCVMRRKVLVEVHARRIVAVATSCQVAIASVAHATFL